MDTCNTLCACRGLPQGCAVDEVVATILKSGGPENNGTQAEAVKWHDDKVGAAEQPVAVRHSCALSGALLPANKQASWRLLPAQATCR